MSKKQMAAKEGFNEILLYTTPNGKVKVEIYLQNETIRLTQQKIAHLFGEIELWLPNNIFGKGYFEKQLARIRGTKKDWVGKLDAFLQLNEEAVLKHQGIVSH